MAKVRVTQIASTSGCTKRQKDNVRCLGIRRMHHTVELEKTPVVMGMIAKVRHLLNVEDI